MALSWAFFALGIVWALSTLNALRPVRWGCASVPTFFAGWFVSELPIPHLAAQAVATGLFVWGGALHHWPGLVASGLAAASWVGLAVLEASSHASWGHVASALAGASVTVPASPAVPFAEARLPVARMGRSVVRERNVDYWGDGIRPHLLDVYRSPDAQGGDGRPVLLYIHGGAWILGDKREQGRPMIHHLAREGWVCATINYRLCPRASWPDPVVDCLRAVAWIKDHVAEFGGDPDRLVVSGGSAGGHLAALVALAGGDPEFQPGFESADTSVAACVPIYGVYDLTNDAGVYHHRFVQFVERLVVKSTLSENRSLFEQASPYWRIHENAPPFLVLAGRNDTLVPVGEPRRFVEKLESVSRQTVCYAELPFAQHAFEIFPSVRSTYTIRSVEHFFAAVEASRV